MTGMARKRINKKQWPSRQFVDGRFCANRCSPTSLARETHDAEGAAFAGFVDQMLWKKSVIGGSNVNKKCALAHHI
jgi:hypothetical protein